MNLEKIIDVTCCSLVWEKFKRLSIIVSYIFTITFTFYIIIEFEFHVAVYFYYGVDQMFLSVSGVGFEGQFNRCRTSCGGCPHSKQLSLTSGSILGRYIILPQSISLVS